MGVDEVLDDQTFGFGTHTINVGPKGKDSATWRRQATLANFKPLLKLYSALPDSSDQKGMTNFYRVNENATILVFSRGSVQAVLYLSF